VTNRESLRASSAVDGSCAPQEKMSSGQYINILPSIGIVNEAQL
jgi:hypothetical protein